MLAVVLHGGQTHVARVVAFTNYRDASTAAHALLGDVDRRHREQQRVGDPLYRLGHMIDTSNYDLAIGSIRIGRAAFRPLYRRQRAFFARLRLREHCALEQALTWPVA